MSSITFALTAREARRAKMSNKKRKTKRSIKQRRAVFGRTHRSTWL